jgi:hypothetical protein
MPLTNFIRVFIDTKDGKMVDQMQGISAIPTLSAGQLRNVSIIRSTNQVGAVVDLTLTFNLQNSVGDSNGAYFYISIPSDLFYFNQTLTCKVNGTDVTKLCEADTLTNDWGASAVGIRVEMTDQCINGVTNDLCFSNSTYAIIITGLLNKFIT